MTEEAKGPTCRICMHDINDRTAIKACSHAFCYKCIHQWTSSRRAPLCPICREPIAALVLASGAEEAATPATSAPVEELDLTCLDHTYFLGEVGRLISRTNSVHNQLYRDAYGCGRKGGSRQLQQSLDNIHSVLEALNSYRISLQHETQFDPEVFLQELYRLERQVTSAQASAAGHAPAASEFAAAAAPVEAADEDSQYHAGAGHYEHEEDYWDEGSDDEESWHENLAKTPGRRPTSRHVTCGIKNRPDRVVRNGNYQRQPRR